jgi:hypothetical protein
MICIVLTRTRALVLSFALLQTLAPIGSAHAGDRARGTGPTQVVTRGRPGCAPYASATLGTFQPTPYIMVGGSNPAGGGYSPLGVYGDQTMSLYGPLSPLRVSTAPVLGYTRGYDGQVRLTEANSFSYPNLPSLSPVVYPTESNNYFGPRVNRTPRWGSSAINWIDQN